ncbi:MAG TPA: hypothetical protein VIK08_07670 [Candidatus Limnocylindrales bacterium]
MRRNIGLLLRLHTLTRGRRPATLALAALLALGATVVVEPHGARADPIPEYPVLTVDPTCEPTPQNSDGDTITLTVHGFSFEAGRAVMIYFNHNQASGAESVAPGPAGAFEVALTVTEVGNTPSYEIDAYYVDQGVTDNPTAFTYLNVPCDSTLGTIAITPDCGPANTPIAMHVDLTGFLPNMPIGIQVLDPFSSATVYGQAGPAVPPDPNAASFDFTFNVPANGAYRVVATQAGAIIDSGPPGKTATTGFVAPCSQAQLSPTCNVAGSAPDRYSIQVAGSGLLPNLPVGIIFDSASQPEFFGGTAPVNADGTFGPVEITPYARGPGTYDVELTQQNDSPILHYTHATFTVACPAPGAVTLNPTCAAPQFSGDQQQTFQLQVSGGGFQAGLPVIVTFDPDGLSGPAYTPETTQVAADGSGNFSATLNVLARPAGTYRIAVQQQVNGQLIQGTVPPFNVPCSAPSPKITTVKPNCGDDVGVNPQPYSIEVVGRGYIPGFVQLIFDVGGTAEQFSTTANANGRFDATIAPAAKPAGAYRIAAQQADANHLLSQAFANFSVPCTATLLTVTPNSASPGFVVTVHGSGFPAGKQIELHWSFGIAAAQPIDVTVGADGSFDRQVLIFAHDFSGERELTAGTSANPTAFPGAQATLLVSAGQGSPPSYSIFGGDPSDQPPIILRR